MCRSAISRSGNGTLVVEDIGNRDSASHVPEPVRVRLAHIQRLLSVFQPHAQTAVEIAMNARDCVDVHQRAAMDLPEHIRVDLVSKLLDRFADKCFRIRRDDQRVLVVGVEVGNLFDGDQTHVVADATR